MFGYACRHQCYRTSASEAFEWICTELGRVRGRRGRGECLAVGGRDGRVALICVIKRRDFSAQCARLPDIACAHIDERVCQIVICFGYFAFERTRLSMLSAIFAFRSHQSTNPRAHLISPATRVRPSVVFFPAQGRFASKSGASFSLMPAKQS